MTSREQVSIELGVFEAELARVTAESMPPLARQLVETICHNLAVIQENQDVLSWLDIRAWVVSVRIAMYGTIATMNIEKMLGLGMKM